MQLLTMQFIIKYGAGVPTICCSKRNCGLYKPIEIASAEKI
jgi:hypothetical protein